MAKEDKNNKPEKKKPKFNNYWIYAAIFLLFMGIQFFGGNWSQPEKTTKSQFEQFLRDGDVAKVKIVNHKIAKVF